MNYLDYNLQYIYFSDNNISKEEKELVKSLVNCDDKANHIIANTILSNYFKEQNTKLFNGK